MCHEQRHTDCEPDRADLIARARAQAATMTAADRARQRVDFVWASLNLEPDDPAVSREFVEQVDHQLFGTPAGDGHA
jgi:hypothetical protein